MRAVLIILMATLLAGCVDECVEAGGSWELLYFLPINMGNGVITMAPIYDCEVPK